MHTLQDHRVQPRRLALSLALALVAHLLLILLPMPALRGSWGLQGGAGGGASRATSRFLDGALRGAEVAIELPAPIAPAERVPVPPPQTTPQAPRLDLADVPEPALVIADSLRLVDPAAAAAAAGGIASAAAIGDGSESEGSGDATGAPGGGLLAARPELAVKPRVYVHPRIPDEVGKRKINDYVLIQVLVGTNGRVRDVRVLRSIRDCEECTQAAVEAARRLQFDPQSLDGQLIEWWNEPVRYEFTGSR
ncbi:MAG: TonB family protein [Candidatus Latescibacterota bacterium]|nr:MAG: TonB family protein [Candidatus Latescibacterota bacterium]